MKQIQVDTNISIGGDKTFIIAEIGSNHNQSLDLAYQTIDAAVEAGADAVKFQSLNVDKLYHEPSDAIIALHKRIDLPEEWHKPLKDYCDKKNILFFSSPTYLESVDLLEDLNVSLYKLASAQIGTFPQIIKKVAQTGKPVILSTGLVNYSELEKVVRIFMEAKNDKLVILHCNSLYPTPYDRVCLPLMDTYQKMFNCIVGFSDHTDGISIPIAAVARGAKVIEKHFALSRELPVPDAAYSLEPAEFKLMVDGIRATEKALAENVRVDIQPEEAKFRNAIRTSLVLNRDMEKGALLTESDFIFRRNSQGVDCKNIDQVIGKTLVKAKNRNTILDLEDIG
jgi:sialic acid synthase SpsE